MARHTVEGLTLAELETAHVIKPVQAKTQGHAACAVEGCTKPHHAYGLCNMHRMRLTRHGSVHAVKVRGNGCQTLTWEEQGKP